MFKRFLLLIFILPCNSRDVIRSDGKQDSIRSNILAYGRFGYMDSAIIITRIAYHMWPTAEHNDTGAESTLSKRLVTRTIVA